MKASAILTLGALVCTLLSSPSLAQESGETKGPDANASESNSPDASTTAVPPAPAEVAKPTTLETIPVPTGESAESSKSQKLDEVVVTAQRVVESAQKAAVSVSAIEGAEMSKSGTTNLVQFSDKVPGLVSSGITNFIRGVGTFSIFGFTDPAIAFNYDDVYIGRASATAGTFFDLERIEVLKGPQGTLYGRNATGGAINVFPAIPKLGETNGSANARFGNLGARNLEVAGNLAVGEKSALRIAGLDTIHEGYKNDGTSETDAKSVRLQGLTELTDSLSVRVAGDFFHNAGMGEGRTYVGNAKYDANAGAYTFQRTGFSADEGLYSPASQAYRSTIFVPQVGRNLEPIPTSGPYAAVPKLNDNYYGLHAQVNWNWGANDVTVVPAWRHYESDQLIGNQAPARINEVGDQRSFEVRLSSKEHGMLDYTTGVYYFSEKIGPSTTRVNTSALYVHQVFNSDTDSGAAFGRVTAHLSDSLRLVGGARYTKDKKAFDGVNDVLVLACTTYLASGMPNCPTARLLQLVDKPEDEPFTVPAQGAPPAAQGSDGTVIVRQVTTTAAGLSQSKPTYRGAVEYDVAADSLLYASWETGFRSGGFSIANGYETYKPETITAYTVGSKNQFLNGIFEVNGEAFSWRYTNQQLGHLGSDAAGQNNFIIQNVGTSEIRGAELAGRALLPPKILVGVGLQYLDSTYSSFVYNAPIIKTPVPSTSTPPPPRLGCPTAINSAATAYRVDCSGYPAFNAPKWTLNLAATSITSFDAFDLVLDASTQYRTGYFVGFEYLPEQTTPPVWKSSLTATLTSSASWGQWSIGAYVKNIENNQPETFSVLISDVQSIVTPEPRTFGLALTAKFL